MTSRVFLLSPAHCGGRRAQLLFRPGADFELARRLRNNGAVPIGEVFAFLSGLYFRGKLSYSNRFGQSSAPQRHSGAWVITTDRGLLPVDAPITLSDVQAFGQTSIDPHDPAYHLPLSRSIELLSRSMPDDCQVVLLGSIATGKYVDVLLKVFGERLLFPELFVGRGDMSRGGLLLRAVDEGSELTYVPVLGAKRHGTRPPKLPRKDVSDDQDLRAQTTHRTDGGGIG